MAGSQSSEGREILQCLRLGHVTPRTRTTRETQISFAVIDNVIPYIEGRANVYLDYYNGTGKFREYFSD